MSDAQLDFTFDMSGVDRQALLTDAAQRLDRLGGILGNDPKIAETPEGATLRAILGDVAEFADYPDVHRITDRTFLAQQHKVPVRFSQLAQEYNFYWVYIPIVLFPRHNWAFNMLELEIKLRAGDSTPQHQPRAFQILPNQQFQTLVTANTGLEVRLDENLNFNVQPIELHTPVGGADIGVSAKAAGQLGLVAGPFVYRIKRAKIQHTAVGASRVFWRLDGAEFFQEDTPEVIVIVQVPKAAQSVAIDGRLRAYHSFNFASAGMRQAIEALPQVLRNYVKGGAPLEDTVSYDINADVGPAA